MRNTAKPTILWLLASWNLFPPVTSLSVQVRQSSLYSKDGSFLLGSIRERKSDTSHTAVISSPQRVDQDLEVSVPFVSVAESVGSSLWPSSLAGAILLHCQSSLTQDKSVLELGSGLGLGGFVAGKTAVRCCMTDNDEDLVALLQEHIDNQSHLTASYLDWRDCNPMVQSKPPEDELFDVCLGFDVAYYFHLIAPLVNTIRLKQKENNSLLLVIGQANRESQWNLYHHIKDGGYNQITDEREDPWDGDTRMLLYKLKIGAWQSEEEDFKVDGTVPIAALLHLSSDYFGEKTLTEQDHVATKEDEESQMMSF